jgi:hypothetical protein
MTAIANIIRFLVEKLKDMLEGLQEVFRFVWQRYRGAP